LDYNQLTNGLDQRQISPYQIYNLDVDYPQFFSVDHYTKNPKDDIDINQRIQKVFLDIEVYSENKFDFDKIENGDHPISACTIFSSYEKIFHVFFLLIKKNIDNWNQQKNYIEYLKKQLIDNEYIKEGEFDIVVKTYTNDLPLIKDVWTKIHELDPVILTGFNSDGFDFPYIYYRLKNLYNNDTKSVSKVLSRFGDVSVTNFGGNRKVRFVEYINADLQYLYKPRDDGGYFCSL
jgi:DNA polymerase elongation subunit (family B)